MKEYDVFIAGNAAGLVDLTGGVGIDAAALSGRFAAKLKTLPKDLLRGPLEVC